eukprot:6191018-Pleurochrysis_carterae.AAC.2
MTIRATVHVTAVAGILLKLCKERRCGIREFGANFSFSGLASTKDDKKIDAVGAAVAASMRVGTATRASDSSRGPAPTSAAMIDEDDAAAGAAVPEGAAARKDKKLAAEGASGCGNYFFALTQAWGAENCAVSSCEQKVMQEMQVPACSSESVEGCLILD